VLDEYKVAESIILMTIASNVLFIVAKIYLYLLTSSLAVFAFLIDSMMDVLNDVIALYGVRMTRQPPDADHPYGHGKYDAFVAAIISSFIIAGAVEIIRDTIQRVLLGDYTVHYSSNVGYIFILLCIGYSIIALVEFFYSRKLKIATMEASALHYLSDPIFTVIVFIAVYMAGMGLIIADIVLSIGIATMLLYVAIQQIRKSSIVLLDFVAISEEHLKEAIFEKFPEVGHIHAVRSRSDGIRTFLELHVGLPPDMTLKEAHDRVHEIQDFVRDKLLKKKVSIIIHVEPTTKKGESENSGDQ